MESAIISAVIAGVATIVVAIIGLLSSRQSGKEQTEKYRILLESVFEPLHRAFMTVENPRLLFDELESIYLSQTALVPPIIEREYLILATMPREKLNSSHFLGIEACVESDYNGIRKALGLAYEKRRINYRYSAYFTSIKRSYSSVGLIAICAYMALVLCGVLYASFFNNIVPLIYMITLGMPIIAIIAIVMMLVSWRK